MPDSRPTRRRGGAATVALVGLAVLVLLIAPLAAIASVWAPVVSRSVVTGPAVADAIVEAARTSPTDERLQEINVPLLGAGYRTPQEQVAMAEQLLDGRIALPGQDPAPVTLPFSPDDLDGLPNGLQLWFAGLGVADTLLGAYEQTGREEFYALARDVMLAWDRYERSTIVDRGYLWNDHATAARVRVLSEFWRVYRQRPDYDPAIGRRILEQAARYRAFLADPGRFTFSTNHGLMTNLAMLQLELAFPTLPDGPAFRRLALDREGRQLAFLLDDDGVIHENSAGYQPFGLRVLAMTFRSMTLLGEPIPSAWAQKYERGLEFLSRLDRPDWTLPAVGDTDGAPGDSAITITDIDTTGASTDLRPRELRAPAQQTSVYPLAGYWVDWDGLEHWPEAASLNQTVMTWTQPPAPSHKHADELGVNVWAGGTPWLTGVGYWPFGAASREDAESWTAANAPHLVGEATDSARTSSLLASGTSDQLSAVDAERRGPGDFVARRQVVHVRPDVWVILDHVAGGDASHETVWTLGSGVTLEQAASTGSYRLRAPSGAMATLTLAGSTGTAVGRHSGSLAPFAGWNVVGGAPVPAEALTVTQPAGDAWSVAILTTDGGSGAAVVDQGVPPDLGGSTPDAWTLTLPTSAGAIRLERSGATVSVSDAGAPGDASSLTLVPPPDIAAPAADARAAFDGMARDFPVYQDRSSARLRVSGVMAGLALAQLVALLIVWRFRRRWFVPAAVAALGCWIVLAIALNQVVLRTWEVLRLG